METSTGCLCIEAALPHAGGSAAEGAGLDIARAGAGGLLGLTLGRATPTLSSNVMRSREPHTMRRAQLIGGVMRVYTAVLATETNSFSPIPTGLDAFLKGGGYFPAGQHPETPTLFGAPFLVCRAEAVRRGWRLFEGPCAFAQPGGLTTKEAWDRFRTELLDGLRSALPIDMVILGLHGAMIAEGCDDCEGEILAAVRELVGPKAIVGAVLDPHCHLSEAMQTQADLLILFKQYPHDDIHDRTVELVERCSAMAAGDLRLTRASHDLQMVSPVFTSYAPGSDILARMLELEARPGVVSVSLAQGFAWGDVADMGSKTLVYTRDNPALAAAVAAELGEWIYAQRESLSERRPEIDEALDMALNTAGPVVIAEGSDNAGGGASADSTLVLRRMLERGITDAALGPVWDPVAVSFAFDAGIGARLALRIGGKVGPASGQPLDAMVTVRALRRDMSQTAFGISQYPLGDCALVEIDGIEVVLTSKRSQALDTDLFTNLGCDLAAKSVVVVKSTQHFYSSYAKIAAQVISAETPGTVSLNLKSFDYRKIRHPKWPISA